MNRLEVAFAVALAVCTTAVYADSFQSDFIRLDDPRFVAENPMVRQGLTREGVVWSLTAIVKNNWHPITLLSHMLDVELFGLDPGGHHATNVLLHVLNSLLVFLVLRAATGAALESGAVAALFALHPTHVESVAWVSQRKDLLCAAFWLAGMAAWVGYARRGGAGRYGLVVASLVLALMAKPMAVTLPFALLLMDSWPLGRLERGRLRACVLEKLPLLGIAALIGVVTLRAQSATGATDEAATVELGARLANAVMAYGLYVWKTLWPVDLALLYPHPDLPGGRPWAAWQVVAMAAALLAATGACLRARSYAAFGWLWFGGTLVPVIGLVQVGFQAMADRYLYLPGIGLYVIAAWGGMACARRLAGARAEAVFVAVLAALLLPASWLTHRQVQLWRGSIPLFEHSVRVAPGSYVLHNNLGNALSQAGRIDEAIEHYRRAVAIHPGYASAHLNLGNALKRRGEHYAAAQSYLRAGEIPEDSVKAQVALALAAELEGRDARAEAHLDAAVAAARADPGGEVVHFEAAVAAMPRWEAARRALARVRARAAPAPH